MHKTMTDAERHQCRCNVLTLVATVAMTVTLVALVVLTTINWAKWERIEQMVHGNASKISDMQDDHRRLHPEE